MGKLSLKSILEAKEECLQTFLLDETCFPEVLQDAQTSLLSKAPASVCSRTVL